MINTSQFADAGKASFESLFGQASQALQSAEQLATLNLQVTKTLLAEFAQDAQATLAASSPEDFFKLQTAQWQAAPKKAAAYIGQVQEIVKTAFETQRAAVEAQVAAFQAKLLESVDGAFKNAPGSENAVALVKSAIAAANNAYEGVNQASKQVSEAVAVNVSKFAEAA